MAAGFSLRDFFDLHAARGAGHDDGRFDGAVDQDAEVELALDVEALFDEQALDDAAAGPVCGVTSVMPRIFLASSRGFVGGARQFHAAALPRPPA